MNNLVPDATVCQWPTVVRAGYNATGVYIGNGLVLCAAHSLEGNNLPGGRVAFGEKVGSAVDWNLAEREGRVIEVVEAIAHPNGGPSTGVFGQTLYDGVDLAVCILKSEWSGPVAPVMRIGCESNWLNFAFFNLAGPDRPRMRAVGMGCNQVDYNVYPPCVTSGQKRIWNTWLDPDWPQQPYAGAWKLVHHTPPWVDDDPIEMGDSGSPLFVRVPDGTWRVIGILHGEDANSVYWEPVPPYVDWIEEVTNRTIGLPLGSGFLAHPDANGSWANACSNAAGTSQYCGGGWPLPDPPAFGIEIPPPQTQSHFESWIIEGIPQRFDARLRVNEELLRVAWEYALFPDSQRPCGNISGNTCPNPLQLVANAINCHPLLQRKQLRAVVEGSWLRTNATIAFEQIQISGGRIRRRHFAECDRLYPNNNKINGFLNGIWDPRSNPFSVNSYPFRATVDTQSD